MENSCIKPNNFVIITQKINQNYVTPSTREEYEHQMLVRSLSVVDEDDQENLVGSYSMYAHGIHGLKNRLSKKG